MWTAVRRRAVVGVVPPLAVALPPTMPLAVAVEVVAVGDYKCY